MVVLYQQLTGENYRWQHCRSGSDSHCSTRTGCSMKMAAKETVTKEIEGRMSGSAQEDTCPKEGGDITHYMDLISENLQQLLKHTHHSGQ